MNAAAIKRENIFTLLSNSFLAVTVVIDVDVDDVDVDIIIL